MSNTPNTNSQKQPPVGFSLEMPSCGCGSCATDAKAPVQHSHKKDDHHDHDHDHGGNLKIFLIRLTVALILLLSLGLTDIFSQFELAVYIIAYFLAGYEVVLTAVKNITKGHIFDENFLMTIASTGAFLLGEHSEGVGVMIFYGFGELLQGAAVSRSKKNIEQLMDIRPDSANLKKGNEVVSVSPEEVNIGDIIIVRPGEKIPLDGEVIHGESFVDTTALTGESVPRKTSIGSSVLSGSVNKNGLLEVRVTTLFGESTVAKILKLVQHASEKKAKSEKFITKFARYYTPAVVFTALFIAILPPLFGFGNFNEWIYKSLSFLIISCPCALVLSIPISFFGGIGGAARKGILIKGGNYLEALYNVKTFVFDKTGTLTKGVFKVQEINTVSNVSEDELLEIAAISEAHSTHPIAKSILSAYGKEITQQADITEISGQGIIAKFNNDTIHLGNSTLLESIGITDLPSFNQTCIYIAKNSGFLGYILIADEIKENAAIAIKNTFEAGISNIVMLTGDNKKIAQEISQEIGISDVRAELLPQDKVAELEKIMSTTEFRTAFVGDGINDAPVLSRADIGFAMGGVGSDAAIEAADVVIMNDDISKIPTAIKIAKKTRQIVVQNIIFALGVKLIVMVLAFLGITSIWFAVFADVGVAILAIMNAMRAMFVKD